LAIGYWLLRSPNDQSSIADTQRNFLPYAVFNPPMKLVGRTFAWIGTGLLLNPIAWAAAADSPYDGIAKRNAFGLVPPKIIEKELVREPLPNVLLTGITTILNKKLALITVQLPNRPPESCILAEGEKRGEVEVLHIDETAGVVQVNVRDTVKVLDFKSNGAKTSAAPVVTAAAPALPPPREQLRQVSRLPLPVPPLAARSK
jgi:hypothetical protein